MTDSPMSNAPMLVLDAHEDVIQRVLDKGADLGEELDGDQADIPKWRRGGINIVWFSIWIHPVRTPGTEATDRAHRLIAALQAQIKRHSKDLVACDTAADCRRAVAAGKIAALIGLEGGAIFDDQVKNVDVFRKKGARYCTLTWRGNLSWAGSSQSADPSKGLSDLGKQFVREMNRTGMIVDLSHVSDRTFNDVLDLTTHPVIVSHSNARLLSFHPRNVTDDMLRRIRDNGGVIGVNFAGEFLRPTPDGKGWQPSGRRPNVNTVADQIDHIVKVAGIDHIGLGSDYDGGIRPVTGLETADKLPNLWAELRKRGYTDDEIRKIAAENFLRVIEANEK